MDLLLLYIGDGQQFDEEKVFQILNSVPGVKNLNRGKTTGAIMEGNYDFSSDSTIVRLAEDLETISISGTGDASLQLALEIQRAYHQPLHLVDSDYSFDVVLSDVSSLSGLKSIVGGGSE